MTGQAGFAGMGFTPQQDRAYATEVESAYNLLRYGVDAVRGAAFAVDAYDAILTTLSIGTEKTLKLALGLGDLATSGTWTPATTMKNVYRHDISAMWRLVQGRIRADTSLVPHPLALLQQAAADPVLGPTFDALDMYGQSGRFFHLDELASVVHTGASPFGAWQTAEQAAMTAGVEARTRAAGASATDALIAQFWRDVDARKIIAASLERWRLTIAVCALHGAFGEMGKGFGSTLRRDVVTLPDMPIV